MSCQPHRLPSDDDGPASRLHDDGSWDSGPHARHASTGGVARTTAWILLGVVVVGVGLTLGVLAMRGGAS